MALEIISTIGTLGGEDYPTIASWELATRLDLVTLDVVHIAECSAQEFSEQLLLGGAITDIDHYRVVRPVKGAYHGGKKLNNSFAMRQPDNGLSNYYIVSILEAFSGILGIELYNTSGYGSKSVSLGNQVDGRFVGYCFIHSFVHSTIGGRSGIYCDTYADYSYIFNNILLDLNTANVNLNSISSSSHLSYIKCFNNVVVECTQRTSGTGIIVQKKGDAKNNIVIGHSVCYKSTYPELSDQGNNISSDGTALGNNSFINQTLESIGFKEDNIHLKEGSLAIKSGLNLTGTHKYADLGIDLNTRRLEGAWDIGVDEFLADVLSSGGGAGIALQTGIGLY